MTMLNRIPDKAYKDVLYFDKEHAYIDKNDNSKFISVTTIIDKYKEKFDSDFWSSYKALEEILQDKFQEVKLILLTTKKFNYSFLKTYNIPEEIFKQTKDLILQSYEDNKNIACERGTKIHAEFENSFYKQERHKFDKYGIKGEYICKPNYYDLDIENGIYPEYLIYKISNDGELKIAGQIDLLIKEGNDIYIIDYKTNAKLDKESYYDRMKKSYKNMKFPLNNIMDCNMMHYTLQLSLYAYLLQQINPEFNIKSLKIHHIDHDNNEKEYELEYLKNDVERMLKHYKKSQRIERQLNRDKK